MAKKDRVIQGLDKAYCLYKQALLKVPAYKKFLYSCNISPTNIKSVKDFTKLPIMEKANYLKAFPIGQLVMSGTIPSTISMSSGSSGKPFYWPRGKEQDETGGRIHEKIFSEIFGIKKKDRTLVIICFSMGTWIAGTFTLACCKYIADKGYNLSIITPGIETKDIINILRDFASNFDKVILAGYPPFIMDVISAASENKINLDKINLKILLAGENFSEKWRDALMNMSGLRDTLRDCVGVYGSADANILGHETPLSIFIRQRTLKDKNLRNEFFSRWNHLPTFVQYYPEYKYFEEVDGKLIFTADSGIPLIRYQINDAGKIFSFKEVENILKRYGLINEIKKLGIQRWKMPFIALGGRSDVSVTFYALNIYYENLKLAFEDDRVRGWLTGKFIATTKSYNRQKDQKLIIDVECKKGISPNTLMEEKVKSVLFDNLLRLNAEYGKLYNSIGKRALPEVKLSTFGSPNFQIKKAKHNWRQSNL